MEREEAFAHSCEWFFFFIIEKKFLIRLWKWNYGKLRIETIRLDYRRERGEEDDEISISETIYI